MSYIWFIASGIILPIFIQIVCGFLLRKKVEFQIAPLAKVQFYILIPALMFAKMYQTEIDLTVFSKVIVHSVLLFLILYLISYCIARRLGYTKTETGAFVNSIAIYNSGNYCLPLVQLLYNNPFAFSIQILITTIQNIFTNTVGVFNASLGKKNIRQALLTTLQVPMLYSIFLALLLKGMRITVWRPVLVAMDSLASGLVPLALITLGAQLAETRRWFGNCKAYLSSGLRLLISPVIAYLLVRVLGLHGVAAEVVVISAAAPTAANAVLLAIQYRNEAEFSSQAVFISTIISAITVSWVIFTVSGRF